MAFGSYEVGVTQRTPIPDLLGEDSKRVGGFSLASVSLKRNLDTATETSHVFHLPALLQSLGVTLADRASAWQRRLDETAATLAEHQREIDDIAFRLYGIDGEDRRMIEAGAGAMASPESDDEAEDDS